MLVKVLCLLHYRGPASRTIWEKLMFYCGHYVLGAVTLKMSVFQCYETLSHWQECQLAWTAGSLSSLRKGPQVIKSILFFHQLGQQSV